MQPGVTIYTSNRLEDLLRVLAERLAVDPLPPLVSETVLVPGQGIARWLRFELAEAHGIAAGLELPFAGAWLHQLVRTVTAQDALGPDPYAPEPLAFRIHRLLADPDRQRELGAAARYCENDPDGRKRFQLSSRLATCFDDYQLYRPDLLARAGRGEDLEELGEHGRWQARLWRALLADDNGSPGADPTSPAGPAHGLLFGGPEEAASAEPPTAERLAHLRAVLADTKRARELLPRRLTVFGPSTLPPALLGLIETIAQAIPVTIYVPSPARGWFGDQNRRSQGDGNALLARLGSEAREFQGFLTELATDEWRELHAEPVTQPDSLLECLQQDIVAIREHGRDLPRYELQRDDASVRIHDCHSEQRELEVVRDQILAAFAADRTLAPHEILVLVPDIERYAPYAHAVFGPLADHLPFQVADKSPRSESPLCAVVFQVLELARDRLAVFDVLHLLEEPAVQRRFGLFGSDLPTLRHLCERAGIRWGIDGAMRHRQFQVPEFEDNTWREGLERMLLGIATGPTTDLVLGTFPAADSTSGREELVARLAHFAESVFSLLRQLQKPLTLSQWADRLDDLAAAMFTPSTASEEQSLGELRAATTELRALATTARHREPLGNLVIQDWLELALGRAADSQGFLGGRVTVAAMLPMRAVPVRHLFLCGLHDASFPRRHEPAPFDLVGQHPRAGDRNVRLDDRQMFLDCLMAAREALHITHIGHSQKDDSECAPSTVLAELLDLLDRCVAPPAPFPAARAAVTVRHPLQPWSPRYLDGRDPRLFTYARPVQGDGTQLRTDLDGGLPGRERPEAVARTTDPVFTEVADTEPAASGLDLRLEDLATFFWHPCRWYLRERLHVFLPRRGDETTTTEPFTVDALGRWRVLDHALQRREAGVGRGRDPIALARTTTELPVGGAGEAAFAEIDDMFGRFVRDLETRGELRAEPVRIVKDAFGVHGTLPGVGSEHLVYSRLASLGAKDRLRAWLYHVIAAVARHSGAALPATTVMIARSTTESYRELSEEAAVEQLEHLVSAFRAGQQAPLPLVEKTSMEYGRALHAGKDAADARRAAAKKWFPDPRPDNPVPNDGEDDNHALCFRGHELVELPAFATWAERIWATLLSYTEAR
ncbi:MAG: exodeoxyribonuclease V subunit gamma [bacterium]|nr:exodeoxyribonuclease V subunit gamma [bacterium]